MPPDASECSTRNNNIRHLTTLRLSSEQQTDAMVPRPSKQSAIYGVNTHRLTYLVYFLQTHEGPAPNLLSRDRIRTYTHINARSNIHYRACALTDTQAPSSPVYMRETTELKRLKTAAFT